MASSRVTAGISTPGGASKGGTIARETLPGATSTPLSEAWIRAIVRDELRKFHGEISSRTQAEKSEPARYNDYSDIANAVSLQHNLNDTQRRVTKDLANAIANEVSKEVMAAMASQMKVINTIARYVNYKTEDGGETLGCYYDHVLEQMAGNEEGYEGTFDRNGEGWSNMLFTDKY